MLTCMHACMHACIDTYMHALIQTYITLGRCTCPCRTCQPSRLDCCSSMKWPLTTTPARVHGPLQAMKSGAENRHDELQRSLCVLVVLRAIVELRDSSGRRHWQLRTCRRALAGRRTSSGVEGGALGISSRRVRSLILSCFSFVHKKMRSFKAPGQ